MLSRHSKILYVMTWDWRNGHDFRNWASIAHESEIDFLLPHQINLNKLSQYTTVFLCAGHQLLWGNGLVSNLEQYKRIQKACDSKGIRVLNRIEQSRLFHRYEQFPLVGQAKVRYPDYRYPVTKTGLLNDPSLWYPFIFRTESSNGGRDAYLITNREDLVRLNTSLIPPQHIAIRFVDTRGSDGKYRKKRCVVIGNSVIRMHCVVSNGWNVHIRDRITVSQAVEEEKVWWQKGDGFEKDMIRLRKTFGLDVMAVDYSTITGTNELIIFEIQIVFATAYLLDKTFYRNTFWNYLVKT